MRKKARMFSQETSFIPPSLPRTSSAEPHRAQRREGIKNVHDYKARPLAWPGRIPASEQLNHRQDCHACN
jgi:hypothetical protein